MKTVNEIKKALRSRILKLLKQHKEEDRLKKSAAIGRKLFRTPEFKRSKTILFYASFGGEVETQKMIDHALKLGKKIGLPRILRGKRALVPILMKNLTQDLENGPYGIKHPKRTPGRVLKLKEIDLVIVPGLAFDKSRNRLGRGAGYYDRFIKKLPSGTPTVGLAFDFQVLDRLPTADHDLPVSYLLHN